MIVMKFGGTSVEDAEAMRRVLAIISRERKRDPVVVLSAASGVTNMLITVAEDSFAGRLARAVKTIDALEARHKRIAAGLVDRPPVLEGMYRQIEKILTEVRTLANGVSILGELSPRSRDSFLAVGERLSTLIFSTAAREAGENVALIDARTFMITDDAYTRARPQMKLVRRRVAQFVRPEIEQKKIIVTQGFIGGTIDGSTTTVGRGGSDFTASLLGVALGASEIQIWTDVDGILTTDPKLVAHARPLHRMSFTEASELAYFGARVLHPETILPAVEENIPVRVLNSRKPAARGTLIVGHTREKPGVKSVAYKKHITLVDITSTRMLGAVGFLQEVFNIFEKYNTVCDAIATSEVSVSITIDNTKNLKLIVTELEKFAQVSVTHGRAIVCVVGGKLKNIKGIAGKVFHALRDVNINMISQGASKVNLGFVISERDVPRAVKKLHKTFFE